MAHKVVIGHVSIGTIYLTSCRARGDKYIDETGEGHIKEETTHPYFLCFDDMRKCSSKTHFHQLDDLRLLSNVQALSFSRLIPMFTPVALKEQMTILFGNNDSQLVAL
ncbi:hypothetical protein KIN20_025574 [Parelaphostrongylus tenuis]|uniref:Uncharacterized protein n=1 Tax=Parelaphostrongylus tenuis TaxID=148309 RepID=A0AAD5NAV5_PARTN|nr:hypothetical protein KIN20_025574 [Parelaphostrongylus tenuis]